MPVLKLTKAELAAVDAMIETLERKGAGKGTKVPLQDMVALPSTIMHVLRITASKGNLVADDAKALAKIEKLTVSLQSKMTLDDLLEFRRQATAPKG
jgi:hypothetical protein